MSRNIAQINTTDTFQVWLQRTNDVISEIGSTVVTASTLGDSTVGNATLFGSFTANTVVAHNLFRTNIIDTKVGNTSPITVRGAVDITASGNQTPLTIKNSLGPRISIENNSIAWQVGLRGSAGTGTNAEFVIGVEGSDFALRIGADGILRANTILLTTESSSTTSAVRADRIISSGDGLSGGGNLTQDREISLTGTPLALFNLSTNGFVARTGSGTVAARTLTEGTGITIDNGGGVSGNPIIAVDSTVVRTTGNVTIGGIKTFTSKANFNGAVDVAGALGISGAATFNSTALFKGAVNVDQDLRMSFNTDRLAFRAAPSHGVIEARTNLYLDLLADGNVTVRNSVLEPRFVMDTDTGNFTADGSISSTSDARLKTDIRTIEGALDKVSNMRGVYFNKDGRASVGVIAQEMQSILPEVVDTNEEFLTVAYGNIVGVLIEAIKELKKEIETLRGSK